MPRDRLRDIRIAVCAVVAAAGIVLSSPPAFAQTAARQSVRASMDHLARVMDQFHDRFPVYDDVSSAGNHFHALAKIPNENAAVSINGSWTQNPHSGATAIRCQFTSVGGTNYGGFYFLNGVLPPGTRAPELNFGKIPQAGIDLSGATALTFWAPADAAVRRRPGNRGRDPRPADHGLQLFLLPQTSRRRDRVERLCSARVQSLLRLRGGHRAR